MKEGKVAELGTHQELMALDGEYASLYNVQAQAFTPEVRPFCLALIHVHGRFRLLVKFGYSRIFAKL